MKRVSNLIGIERNRMPMLSAATLVVSLTGFITYLFPTHGVWQQWTYLLHTLAGIYLTIILLPYIFIHFRRTLGIRRPIVLITGILSIVVLAGLVISGLHISIFGQQESLRWISRLHITSAYLSILILIAHLVVHRLLEGSRRRKSEDSWFPTLRFTALKTCIISIIASICTVGLITLIYNSLPSAYYDEAVIKPYKYSYGEHPFRPSQTETITGGFMDVRRVGGSDKCAPCHSKITEEWKSSIHSQAASDKTYQTNINLLAKKKGMEATRYCEGCHAPVALLSGELTTGGRLDTNGHLNEGVSCMSCHGIDRVMHLKGVASYRFAPANDYLFADKEGFLTSKLHNYLVRIQPRQHRIDMSREIISDSQLCATCHAQFMDKDMNDWGWVKMQDEYSAWLKSPYSKQSQQTFSHTSIKRCHDCHMPLITGNDPSADKNGLIRSHRTLGANTAIPWYNGDTKQLALTNKFLQADKVRISIEEPNRVSAIRSRKYIAPTVSTDKNAPAYFYLGETVNLEVVVTNLQVGHDFPGGTTDINEVWIYLRVVDAQNNTLYTSGALNADRDVDPAAYFYRSTPIDRHGKHVWKHDLFNMVGDSYKKVVPSGESDIVSYNFTIPSWVKSPLTVSTVLRYRKFNNRYAKWALKEDNINLPIVDIARDAITLPVRLKKEVE